MHDFASFFLSTLLYLGTGFESQVFGCLLIVQRVPVGKGNSVICGASE